MELVSFVEAMESAGISSDKIVLTIKRYLSHQQPLVPTIRLKGSKWQDLRYKVLERDNYECSYCDDREAAVFHIDHIIPISRGGTNDLSNLCVACRDCNIQKGDKLLSEWNPICQ